MAYTLGVGADAESPQLALMQTSAAEELSRRMEAFEQKMEQKMETPQEGTIARPI